MNRFSAHDGVAAALRLENVDTDVIIPMALVLSTPRHDLGRHAFQALRYDEDGRERPEFVLNQQAFRGASILVCGRNFGCGSSREAAVYALDGLGVRVVIAPSFGDIFYGNCIKNGIVPIRLPVPAVERLMTSAERAAVDAGGRFRVDLEARRIEDSFGNDVPFEIDPGHRRQLLDGKDEVTQTLDEHRDQILAYRARDRAERPWIWATLPARSHEGRHR